MVIVEYTHIVLICWFTCNLNYTYQEVENFVLTLKMGNKSSKSKRKPKEDKKKKSLVNKPRIDIPNGSTAIEENSVSIGAASDDKGRNV